MHGPVADVGLLGQPVPGHGVALADALGVETHAPAPAPDPVVGLHQTGKIVPGVRAERSRHIGAGGGHASIVSRAPRTCPGSVGVRWSEWTSIHRTVWLASRMAVAGIGRLTVPSALTLV